jgi:2-hydroxymuconate-semialdehyde hydrolase
MDLTIQSDKWSGLEEKVLEIVRSSIPGAPDIDASSPLLDLGLIDSLSIIEIVTQLEERFSVQMPDQLLVPESFANVSAIAAAVRVAQGSSTL